MRVVSLDICGALVLLVAAVCNGCSAGGPAAGTGSTTATPAVTAKARFAYTGNEGGSVSGYSVASNGALTSLAGFPLSLGGNPIVVAHDPQNRFLIVGDIAFSQLTVFSINSTSGALTQTSQMTGVKEPAGAVLDPTGTHVYVVSQGSNYVGAYTLSSTGVLAPVAGQPFATGGTQDFGSAIAINPAGTSLFVQDETSVYVFSISQTTGALALAQTVAAPGIGYGGLGIDPAGAYLYVAEGANNLIATYSVNSATGSLTLLKSIASTSPSAIAVSPTGQFLFVLIEYQKLQVYALASGTLTAAGSATGFFGEQIGVDPSGGYLYVPQACSQNCPGAAYNVLSEFTVNSSGALGLVAGSPVATGITPTGITLTQ